MKKSLLFFMSVICYLGVDAQDLYFSQYSYAPMLINPGFAGYINCDMRATANYRNQWAEVTKPYVLSMISADAKFKTGFFTKDRDWMGVGGYVYNQKAGDGDLKHFKANLLTSYNLGLNRDNSTFITGGFSFGFNNQSIDFNKLFFEDQFDGTGFSGQTSDPISNQSYNFFDFSAGLIFTFQIKDQRNHSALQCNIGASMDYINRPKETFYNDGFRKEQMVNFHGGAFGEVGENILLNLEAWFRSPVNDFTDNDITLGANLLFPFNNTFSLYGGIWYRWNKSIIPMVGFEVTGWRLLFSYDISVSDIQPAGTFEFSLSKTFCFHGGKKTCLPCPSFGSDVKGFQRY